MTLLESLSAGMLLAIAGIGHCAGMCGALSMTLGFSVAEERRQGTALWLWHGLYSLGRISTYVLLGSMIGAGGQRLMGLLPGGEQLPWLIAALVMLMVAAYLMGREFGVRLLERAGMHLWRRVQPLMKPLMPVQHPAQALALGLLWGLMPCGLVYSALALAAVTGSAYHGALLMLLFGLITVFPVMSAGVVSGRFEAAKGKPLRRVAATSSLVFALWLGSHALPGGHHAHGAHSVSDSAPHADSLSSSNNSANSPSLHIHEGLSEQPDNADSLEHAGHHPQH